MTLSNSDGLVKVVFTTTERTILGLGGLILVSLAGGVGVLVWDTRERVITTGMTVQQIANEINDHETRLREIEHHGR